MNETIGWTAREAKARLDAGEVSHGELLEALEARIAAVDGPVNALPTLCFERARAAAAAIAARPVAERGVLGGLPVAVKDLEPVAGVRTTFGSPIYADHVPERSSHVVERMEAEGAVVYAKSNTPEFGAGASTFNPVHGRTANPHDISRSPAGSSGGAGAALASGTAWLAHGSDMGGSLRLPASFCGVVGLRPGPGLVPRGPSEDPFNTLSVEGPMARNVGDVGLFLDAMAGPHPAEPLALPGGGYRAAAEAPRAPLRVAFSADLGIAEVAPEVAEICAAAARRFERLGAVVEEAHPDLSEAHAAFQALRGLSFAAGHAEHYADHRALLKPDVVWNIERGLALSGAEIAAALAARGRIVDRLAGFLERYDLLLCPASPVPPFPVGDRTVTSVNGAPLATYIDWLALCYAITLTAAPALSLPCGQTSEGWPIGLQMVGRLRGEAALLSHAAALEAELGRDLSPVTPKGIAP